MTKKLNKYLLLSRLPERYWGCSIEKIDDKITEKNNLLKIYSSIDDNIKKGESYYFWGDYGNGKTAYIAILLKALFPKSCLFLSSDEFTDKVIRNVMFNDDITFWERACNVNLLILDDLGREYSREFGRSLIEKVVRYRSDRKLSCIITSNLSPNQFGDTYGQGIKSVMKESYIPIKFEGYDYRNDILADNIKRYKNE